DAVWRLTDTAPAKAAFDTGKRGAVPVRAGLVESDELMRSLGRPNREQVVTTRPEELSTLQALDLTNGRKLSETLDRGAKNLRKKHPDWKPEQYVDFLYRGALCRPPTPAEAATGKELLGPAPTDDGVADLLWVVFMLPEFQLVR